MAISKVILNGTTLIDVTDDTVASSNLLSGYTATGADGNTVSGAYIAPTFSTQTKFGIVPTESSQTITPDSGYDGLSAVQINGISSAYVGTGVNRVSAQTIIPSTVSQYVNSGVYLTGSQTIQGDVNLLSSNIASGVSIFGVVGTFEGGGPSRSEADLVATGSVVSGPAGTYSEAFSRAVDAGSISFSGTKISLSTNPQLTSANGQININYQNTAKIVSAIVTSGYISSNKSSALNITVSGGLQLPSLAAQTLTPTTTNQTIAQYQWLTGSQTILGDSNLLASNIASGVSIFGVVGTFEGGASAVLGSKTITANGIYSASNDGYDGYSEVTVDVGSGGGEEIDALIMRTITSYSNSTISIIGYSAFAGCSSLSTVNIPSCVSLYQGAFQNCTSLKSISLPECMSIGPNAFNWCDKLSEVSIPKVRWIGGQAFGYCKSLTSIYGPSVSQIYQTAFQGCTSLSYAWFPSCTSVGSDAFGLCSRLTEIVLSSGLMNIYSSAFSGCTALSTEFSFPNCSIIGAAAFSSCWALTKVSFPSCGAVGSSAFYYCNHLSQVYIGNATIIYNGAFMMCHALESINGPSVTAIYQNAFSQCSALSYISFPNCITISQTAFCYCSSLTAVSFPNCEIIYTSAFYYCSGLSEINFPKCSMVHSGAFFNCDIRSATFASVSSDVVGGKITIGINAFYRCENLSTIRFDVPVSFSSSVFMSNYSLESVYLLGSTVASIASSNVFSYTPMVNSAYLDRFGSIFVPASLLSNYKAHTVWKTLSARITEYVE